MVELENFLKEFGRQLKTTRKQMGLSQVTAAQNMRIDYRHYQNIEGGKINLRLDTLIKLVKFYNIDKAGRSFNVDSCMDLLATQNQSSNGDYWSNLFRYFVEGGRAGFMAIDGNSRQITELNPHLQRMLGLQSPNEGVGKPISQFLSEESAKEMDALIQRGAVNEVSKPFIVTFRPGGGGFPLTMMSVAKINKDNQGQSPMVKCIFMDRKMIDSEGQHLKEMLHGYQQFMELYPRLKVV